MKNSLNIAMFGSSLVSAYWNGAATYYRGMVRALSFSFSPAESYFTGGGAGYTGHRDEALVENWLDSVREADAFSFDVEGD